MANQHTGNTQPAIDQEEHARIGGLDGKKTFIFDNAGNQITSFGGSPNTGNVTLNPSPNFIGIVTVANNLTVTPSGNVTLDDGSLTGLVAGAAYVGLVTVDIGTQNGVAIKGNVTLSDSKGFIGLVSIAQPINANVSLGASAQYIGLATVDIGTNNTVKSVVSLSNSVANIGFATVNLVNTINANVSLGASAQYIGIVSLANSGTINANVSLGSSVSNIGFATVRIGTNVNTNIGLVTVDGGTVKSLVSLGASEQYIGLATVKIGTNVNTNIGLVTIDGGTVKSLVSLGASVQNIGFATIFQAFPGGATVYSGVISATGNTTVFVAPASNLFFLKDLHISSLGRAELEIRSGATTLIPFTSLSTTSGFHEYYGEYGKPSRAQADGLVINLNGGATISYAATVRFGV